jgi:hypothetical protein
MATPQSKVTYTFTDADRETSSFDIFVREMNATNFDAITTEVNALVPLIGGISIGRFRQSTLVAEAQEGETGPAANAYARRELKWLLYFRDIEEDYEFTRELPCPKLDEGRTQDDPNQEWANLSNAAWASFKTAVDALIRSPTGNPAALQRAKVVGRNL